MQMVKGELIMKLLPYKIKSEILVEADKVLTIFVCDPEKNVECNKRECGKECKMTTNIKYAKHYDIGE